MQDTQSSIQNLSKAEILARMDRESRDAFINKLTTDEKIGLIHDWEGFNARPDQIMPLSDDWDVWLIMAGRGWGKTRTGAESVKMVVENGEATRIALIAETAADGRDVLIEGASGILSLYPENKKPLYEPSKRRVTWFKNDGTVKAVATMFNATEPDQLRGPQFDFAWCDELAKWKYMQETWDNLQFGLRLGKNPRCLVTTTPRPVELVKRIFAGKEGRVKVTRGNTMDNSSNLSHKFLDRVKKRYEGTRLGRQELAGEILGDLPGALFSYVNISAFRRDFPKDGVMVRKVVAIDPAITQDEESNYHGIIVVGIDSDNHGWVLEDASIQGSPKDWASRAISMYDRWNCDTIVAEINQGGDMVENTLLTIRKDLPFVAVRATKGKHIRAEPISALYEKGLISHTKVFDELEEQMILMTDTGYNGKGSPDRVDAMVWGFTELFPEMVDYKDSFEVNKHKFKRIEVV